MPATVLVVDVESFTTRTNPVQLSLRHRLYELLPRAFNDAGVSWRAVVHEDRGDGLLVVLPASVAKLTLLRDVVGGIAGRVDADGGGDRHAVSPSSDEHTALRLRVAVHAGEVHRDPYGFAGADVNHAFRLLDAPPLREALASSGSHCAVLVSDSLYQTIVRHGYPGLDPRRFHPVPVDVKQTRASAWLHVPGDDGCARRVSRAAAGHGQQQAPDGGHGGVQISAGRNVTVRRGLIVGGDVH